MVRSATTLVGSLESSEATALDFATGYAAMAADEAREQETEAWSEALIGDASDEPRGG